MNSTAPAIALTTDFGNSFYVGQMKGVLARLAPNTPIIDLTHEIEPQNVLQGAIVLQDSFRHFPPGTIHIAVVDPGVGTSRPIVAMKVGDQWLIGPDNGLLSGIAKAHPPDELYLVTNPKLWVTNPKLWNSEVSHTFHGRDIMAPAAAYLANGGSPSNLGEKKPHLNLVDTIPTATVELNKVSGRTLFADRYGNLLSNILATDLERCSEQPVSQRVSSLWISSQRGESSRGLAFQTSKFRGTIANRSSESSAPPDRTFRLVRTYGDANPGELIGTLGSSGRLELSVVNGSAAELLGKSPLQLEIERSFSDSFP